MGKANRTTRRKYPQDLSGIQFGMLVAERKVGMSHNGSVWLCTCECGKTLETRRSSLVQGCTKSCGCLKRRFPPVLNGNRYGILIVIGRDVTRPRYWRCRCDCGVEKSIRAHCLKAGETRSCGCSTGRFMSQSLMRHGMTGTPIYSAWSGIVNRGTGGVADPCYDGIRVCRGWRSFETFYRDMGDRPTNSHSIDRIDNEGHYTCGKCDECTERSDLLNCRWATSKQQSLNRHVTRWITHNGQTQCMTDWARTLGIGCTTICYRLKHGWSEYDALTVPPGTKRTMRQNTISK